MGADGSVSGFVHGGHARTVLFGGEALDVRFQGNRPHCRTEVEESRLWGRMRRWRNMGEGRECHNEVRTPL